MDNLLATFIYIVFEKNPRGMRFYPKIESVLRLSSYHCAINHGYPFLCFEVKEWPTNRYSQLDSIDIAQQISKNDQFTIILLYYTKSTQFKTIMTYANTELYSYWVCICISNINRRETLFGRISVTAYISVWDGLTGLSEFRTNAKLVQARFASQWSEI